MSHWARLIMCLTAITFAGLSFWIDWRAALVMVAAVTLDNLVKVPRP